MPPLPPILRDKHHEAPSAFTPESLLREAKRQKGADAVAVPEVCLLDPDGDMLRHLRAAGLARKHAGWVCYHTEMWVFEAEGREIGLVACAVGGAFAVLLAEEMFASDARLLISVTSAGQIAPLPELPCFILVEKALRDEGTSYHYLPPGDWAEGDAGLMTRLAGAFEGLAQPVLTGPVWTTDAPFRETGTAIAAARAAGAVAVEMETASLYAFAAARGRAVVCLAHVTNQMGQVEGDFEKGAEMGARDALALVARVAARLAPGVRSEPR